MWNWFSFAGGACTMLGVVMLVSAVVDYRSQVAEYRRREQQRRDDEAIQNRPCAKCGGPMGHMFGNVCNGCTFFGG